jgi:nucleotide-binding universal stress UspA family protein
VLEGEPARTIARHAQEIGADLIVMASHGWGGPKRTVLGSVAARTIDQSTVPVIVIRAGTTVPARLPERVLVPLDGSLKSAAVLGAVVPLACRLRWQVTLLSVVRPVPARDQDRASGTEHSTEALHAADAISFLAPLAERLRHDGIDARVLTLAGEPAPTIAELVRREQFDLVAMSTRGLCHDRWTASHSITREVAGHVGVPLLTVRPVQVPTQAEIEGWLRRAPREADGDGSVAERVELEHKLWDACGAGGMREGVHSVAAKN